MIAQNWLVGYADFDKLTRVFQGMSRRSRFKSGMENAVTDLKKDYTAYLEEFRNFFPDLIDYVQQYRKDISVI
jgi:acyl carrier protein phosphodiesterase